MSTYNLCKFRFLNSRLPTVIKMPENEKFVKDFVVHSKSSLDFLAFYMYSRVPNKRGGGGWEYLAGLENVLKNNNWGIGTID